MTYPDSLPAIIFWKMGSGIVLNSLPRTPIRSISSSGNTNATDVRPNIPGTAKYPPVGWRVDSNDPWRPMKDLPKEWMHYLNRGDEFR